MCTWRSGRCGGVGDVKLSTKVEKMNWGLGISEEEFNRQFEQARIEGIKQSTKVRAKFVRYSPLIQVFTIVFTNRVQLQIPLHTIPQLKGAEYNQLANCHISGTGDSIHWEDLDLDFDLHGLISKILEMDLT